MPKEPTIIPLTEKAQQLLEARGISAETAANLGWSSLENRDGDCICIPFLRSGAVVNRKFRRINKKPEGVNFWQDTGGEQCFYNLAAIEDVKRLSDAEQAKIQLVITEGEFDCAVALQCGYLAVSVPSGAPSEKIADEDSKKFDFLKDLPRRCVLLLAVDSDPAGLVLRQEIALRAGWWRCKWVQYPKGCKDLNEVMVKYGKKGVDKVLKEKAAFMNAGGLYRMNELPEVVNLPTYGCGIGNLDAMIKLRQGCFIVATGYASMGKSQLIGCLMGNMAVMYGWQVCMASFETHPRAEIQDYLRTYYNNMPPSYSTAQRLADADSWISENFSFIVPDDDSDELTTLKWVLAQFQAAIVQHGAKLLIIDPWNELDHDRPNGMSLTEYVSVAIKELKRLARRYMVTVLVIAHPAKPLEKTKLGTYPVPTLYEISDSAHWHNKCDIGFIIHRLEGEPDSNGNKTWATLVRVEKVRHWGVLGKIGDCLLKYSPSTGRYTDNPLFVPKREKKPAPPKNAAEKAVDEVVEKQQKLPYSDS